MGQISSKLRRATNGYSHWCPGCEEMHIIPGSWTFNGNLEVPTFSPSVKITGKQILKSGRGEWTGGWVTDSEGKTVDWCCHYILTDGQLQFQNDSTHVLKGQTVPLPDLPEWLRD